MTFHLLRTLDAWVFPPQAFVSQIVKVERAAREVQRALGDVDPAEPEAFDLQSIYLEIRSHWAHSGTLEGLSRRAARMLPWVLFFPRGTSDGRQEAWLGADPKFLASFRQWSASRIRPSGVATLITVLLRQYPRELEAFPQWRAVARHLVVRRDSIRLTRWRDRLSRFRLLNDEGPEVCVEAWLEDPESVAQFLEKSGLDAGGPQSRLLELMCRALLGVVRRRLEDRTTDADSLEADLKILCREQGGLRFDSLAQVTAESLLLPFATEEPPQAIQNVIRRFLLGSIGDPRVRRGAWQAIPKSATRILRRWLVTETLDVFFRLLDVTALDRHWKDRREFWKGYLNAGVISDAWLILGPDARQRGRAVLGHASEVGLGEAGGTWARLGGGGDRSQSVLLMKLGNLTIVEWSHMGYCRVWLDGSVGAPRLYESHYRRSGLKSRSCDKKVRHDQYGNWMGTLSKYIRYQTGVRRG